MKQIPLTKGYVAVVDDEDFERVNARKWHALVGKSRAVYAERTVRGEDGKQSHLLMHRFILGITDPKVEVDHRDHDGLNNRRGNLRACSKLQNQHNQQKPRGKSSKFKGVSWFKHCRRWAAQIMVKGKAINIGYYKTELEAARAYDAAAKEHFGEFAHVNFQ